MKKELFVALFAATLGLSAAANAQSITVAPGSLYGYIPLAAFGYAPIAGMTNDGHAYFNTPSFSFGGETWSGLEISENGFVKLGNASVPDSLWTSPNLSLPTSTFTSPIIAPFWSDIDSSTGSISIGTLTDGVATWLIVDWANVTLSGSAIASSFSVWFEVGADDISFEYGTMGTTSAFTVGAQDTSGTVGTNYLYNSGSIVSGSGLKVTSSGLPVPPAVPESSTWAMIVCGALATGAALRRRKTTITFS